MCFWHSENKIHLLRKKSVFTPKLKWLPNFYPIEKSFYEFFHVAGKLMLPGTHAAGDHAAGNSVSGEQEVAATCWAGVRYGGSGRMMHGECEWWVKLISLEAPQAKCLLLGAVNIISAVGEILREFADNFGQATKSKNCSSNLIVRLRKSIQIQTNQQWIFNGTRTFSCTLTFYFTTKLNTYYKYL